MAVFFCSIYGRNNPRPSLPRPRPLFRPWASTNFEDQQNVPQRAPIFPSYNNIQMVTCHQGNVVRAQQNVHCSNVQSTSCSQVVSAHQENVTDALQLVTAEQQGGSSVQQQVSATQIDSDGSEQVRQSINQLIN